MFSQRVNEENIVQPTMASKLFNEFEKVWSTFLIKIGWRNTNQELEREEKEKRKREEAIATVEHTREIALEEGEVAKIMEDTRSCLHETNGLANKGRSPPDSEENMIKKDDTNIAIQNQNKQTANMERRKEDKKIQPTEEKSAPFARERGDYNDDFIIRRLNDPSFISDPHFELLRIDIFEPICIFEILRQRESKRISSF